MENSNVYSVELTKTLYQNMYRGRILTAEQEIKGYVRIIPTIPLDRSLIPPAAPQVPYYLLVIVEDADINQENLLAFEESASLALLRRFKTETSAPAHCEFYYPSPAFNFTREAVARPKQ